MTTTTRTAGQDMTAELRRYFSVGPRTRRYRERYFDLHAEMIEAIGHAAARPGYFTERTERILRAGIGAAYSYDKHVSGYRISATTIAAVNALSPWHFAALLGQMVDAGVENVGQGEQFFRTWTA
jgi:hypothetical protein